MLRLLLSLLVISAVVRAVAGGTDPVVNTFSIVAFDPKTGDVGVAVQSKYFGVGSVVPWAKAGVGAVATQSMAKMAYGSDGLALMAQGKSAGEALAELLGKDLRRDNRQVAMIDVHGNVSAHTGVECFEWAGDHHGENFSVQGNLLAGKAVVDDMAAAFEKARASGEGELAEWMLAALEAAQAAGGDRRGQQSAALLVCRDKGGPGGDNDRYIDLRVDDHAQPIEELARLLKVHREFYHSAPVGE